MTLTVVGEDALDDPRGGRGDMIADEVETPIEEIWPDIYSPKVVPAEAVAQTVESCSDMDAFYGFGNIMA